MQNKERMNIDEFHYKMKTNKISLKKERKPRQMALGSQDWKACILLLLIHLTKLKSLVEVCIFCWHSTLNMPDFWLVLEVKQARACLALQWEKYSFIEFYFHFLHWLHCVTELFIYIIFHYFENILNHSYYFFVT